MKNIINRELDHFKALSRNVRRMIISYALMGAANPIIGTFINAFIWRQKGSIATVALYNLGNFIALAIAFYLNGMFLKKINIKILYFFGAIMTALVPLTFVFFTKFNPFIYFSSGFMFGIGYGFYWSNRNYLTWKETQGINRNYYTGLAFSIDSLNNIVMPFIAGWLIYLLSGFIPLSLAYQVTMIGAFILLLSSGVVLYKGQYITPPIKELIIKKTTKKWYLARVINTVIGVIEGIAWFFPSFIILTNLGKEATLGTINSAVYLISVFISYYYGRKASHHDSKTFFLVSIVAGALGALIYSFFFNNLATYIYIALNGVSISFLWVTSGPILWGVIDGEEKIGADPYAMTFDLELFLNIGRIISLSILFFVIYFFGQITAFRYSPSLVYVLQIVPLLFILKKIKDY